MSEIAITENSGDLLDTALDAAGGLDRWRQHSFLSAHLSQGGGLWAMKGQAGVLDDVQSRRRRAPGVGVASSVRHT